MSILALLVSVFVSQAFAIDVSYPISELGNCGNVDECAAYCDVPANYAVCTWWATEKGPSEMEVLDDLGITFPIPELGNCTDTVACMNYCDQPANVQACLRWAERHGVTGDEEIAAKMEGITFPISELGNCGSPSACADFCSQSGNMQACMDFSVAKGWGGGPPPGMGGIEGPGGCSSQQECDVYCSRRENKEECTRWAEKHGMPHGGPGGCTSDEECRAYCESHPDDEECQRGRDEWCQEHPDECPPAPSRRDEADGEAGQGPGEGGPGGCQSEEECQQYCQQHPNDEECNRGHDEWCREHPDECQGPPEGEVGPCQGEEECRRYCQENPESEYCRGKNEEYCQQHPDECKPEGGGSPPAGEAGPPEQLGPGGCRSEEECRDYCSKHQDDPACQGGPPQ